MPNTEENLSVFCAPEQMTLFEKAILPINVILLCLSHIVASLSV